MEKITDVTLAHDNMSEVLTDPDVYGLKRNYSGKYGITHISECEVGDLLSGKYSLIRITED